MAYGVGVCYCLQDYNTSGVRLDELTMISMHKCHICITP